MEPEDVIVPAPEQQPQPDPAPAPEPEPAAEPEIDFETDPDFELDFDPDLALAQEPEPEPEPAPKPKPAPSRAKRTRRRKPVNVLGPFPLYLFVFLVVLFFLVNVFTPDKALSESENRMLQQRPAFSVSALADGSWFQDLESWYADQFFRRDAWIARSLAGLKLLGRHESNGVWLGKDGYLFAQPEPADEDRLAEKTGAMRSFAAQYPSVTMTAAVVPSAASVLTDELPKNAPVPDQKAVLDGIAEALSGAVVCPDMTASLLPHAQDYIYYRTDHHWTSLGAYYAFETLQSPLGIGSVCSYDTLPVSTDFEGTLSSESGSHASRDTVDICVPTGTDVMFYVNYTDTGEKSRSLYKSACLEDKDKYTVFFGGNHPLVEIATTNNNDRVLLVFKDSYANCFMQFLTPYYEKILMLDPRYYYGDLPLLMSSENVTDVLFLYSADTFMTDTSLTDVLLSAV